MGNSTRKAAIRIFCVVALWLGASCLLYFFFCANTDKSIKVTETAPSTAESETLMPQSNGDTTEWLPSPVLTGENRRGEQVFTIDIGDYIDRYNCLYRAAQGRDFFRPPSQWQRYRRDCGIHSPYEMDYYYFTLDEAVYSLPTVGIYVPTNGGCIQEVTVNFDEHSYTESGYRLFREMCLYTMGVFFPECREETLSEACLQMLSLGNQNVFSSEEWYNTGSVPCVLFYRDEIGVYPYFAIGDWDRLCFIPITEALLEDYAEKGVEIHEIP